MVVSVADVLNMSVNELKQACIDLAIEIKGKSKADLQFGLVDILTKNPGGGMNVRVNDEIRMKELDVEREKMQLERERMAHELAMHDFRNQNAGKVFQVSNASALLLTCDESDVGTYLMTFEKIAIANAWPEDRYVATLQCKLTSKALKAFSKLNERNVK